MAITVTPNEEGAAVISVSPTDENGTALAIGDLTNPCWQLMDSAGNVINDRSFDLCPLTALEWLISGDDLAIGDYGVKRKIAFKATYSSTIGGLTVADIPLIDEDTFIIRDMASMPAPEPEA